MLHARCVPGLGLPRALGDPAAAFPLGSLSMRGLLLLSWCGTDALAWWRRVVEVVCKEGPMRVMELVELGAEFTRKENGALHLTREGGHSHRRIVHAADVTGREIERALLAAAAAKGNITFFEHHAAVDLVHTEVRASPGPLSGSAGSHNLIFIHKRA